MDKRQHLRDLDSAATWFADQEPRPAASMSLDGKTYEVRYFRVNRKCYDFMPTITPIYKIDGKRVTRAKFYAS